MTRTITLAVVIAATLFPVAASAQQSWQVGADSIHLYNRDLNLNNAAGRAALLGRVETAAARLCRDSAEPRDCTRAAIASAMQGPTATPLRLAVDERAGMQVAGR